MIPEPLNTLSRQSILNANEIAALDLDEWVFSFFEFNNSLFKICVLLYLHRLPIVMQILWQDGVSLRLNGNLSLAYLSMMSYFYLIHYLQKHRKEDIKKLNWPPGINGILMRRMDIVFDLSKVQLTCWHHFYNFINFSLSTIKGNSYSTRFFG